MSEYEIGTKFLSFPYSFEITVFQSKPVYNAVNTQLGYFFFSSYKYGLYDSGKFSIPVSFVEASDSSDVTFEYDDTYGSISYLSFGTVCVYVS